MKYLLIRKEVKKIMKKCNYMFSKEKLARMIFLINYKLGK
jgi:hypothetical protein